MEILLVVASCLLTLALAWSVRANALAARLLRIQAGRAGEELVGPQLDLSGGADRLEDLVVGSTLRRSAQIDHIVRGPEALVVIEVKNWGGLISGGAEDSHWMIARSGRGPERRRNPLNQAARQARLVREAIGEDVPVRHLVVMAGRGRPASGHFPAGVVPLREVRHVLPGLLGLGRPQDPAVSNAWGKLVEAAFAPDAPRRAARYLLWVEERFGEKPWRTWLVTALGLAAVVWAMGAWEALMALDGALGF